MTVLAFNGVTVGFRGRPRVLDAVTFEVAEGEMVAVWGARRSGRTTLLRVAAGLLQPKAGEVLIDGQRVQGRSLKVGWCDAELSSWQRSTVAEHVAVPLLPRGVPAGRAVELAHLALRSAGIPDTGLRDPRDLDPAELVRAGIARAIITRPRVLVADHPTYGVSLPDADPIMETLRSIAQQGAAVLITVGDGHEAPPPTRPLSLSGGALHGQTAPSPAPVVPIR